MKRAFEILQARFAIIRGPARNMDKTEFSMIMKACVILHNMIVEDERDSYEFPYVCDHEKDSTSEPNV